MDKKDILSFKLELADLLDKFSVEIEVKLDIIIVDNKVIGGVKLTSEGLRK